MVLSPKERVAIVPFRRVVVRHANVRVIKKAQRSVPMIGYGGNRFCERFSRGRPFATTGVEES